MINVFDYTDHRKFLEDYYNEKKAGNRSFSYKLLAKKAGISNKGFVYNLMNGKRNLWETNLAKLCEALGFTSAETEYFKNLVAFNQVKGVKEKSGYLEKLNQMNNRGRTKSQVQVIRKNQYEFYSKWYHSAVRSIIDMYEFRDDYKWLAKMVSPAITVKQARDSVKLLLNLGMIILMDNGILKVTNKSITTGKDIVGLAIANFHCECTDLTKKAIQNLPQDQRNVTGLTLGISHQTYERICEETQEFQKKIMEIADSDSTADRVYQYNFQLFPISKNTGERKKGK